MKKFIPVAALVLVINGCSTTKSSEKNREISSIENPIYQCDNGSQQVVAAGNIIPVNDNLYYPIKNNESPSISFGDEYKYKRAQHRKGVLRPHAVFKSDEPQVVRAIHSGEISRIGIWQGKSFSLTVKSPDGHITRYGGLDGKSLEELREEGSKVGDWLEAGESFAKTTNVSRRPHFPPHDIPTLYIEVFSGEESGGLTQRSKELCFNRRKDILDTSKWLDDIKTLTFAPRDI